MNLKLKDLKIGIIGLGYVGLSLALEFSKKRQIIGYDIDNERIKNLLNNYDYMNEVSKTELKKIKKINYTNNSEDLNDLNCFIITVPTPVDNFKKPDLQPLISASQIVGKKLSKNSLVIYESTVFPGATENICVPILEKYSNLKFNKDFFCGYSPERINLGDRKHSLTNTIKITSGSNFNTSNLVDNLYKSIIKAGTFKVSNIKVAEAAKVIENTQRDLNIAFFNELSLLFNQINLDSKEVFDAASTKWNFHKFRPGLVGGHCIGVDPYYLTYLAQSIGFQPNIILSGRRVNDNMGQYVVSQLIKNMSNKKIKINNSKILILGFAFKENCPDIRNTGVFSIYRELIEYQCKVEIYDSQVSHKNVYDNYKIKLIKKIKKNYYDSVIIAVGHDEFKKLGIRKISNFCKKNRSIFDVNYLFNKEKTDLRL